MIVEVFIYLNSLTNAFSDVKLFHIPIRNKIDERFFFGYTGKAGEKKENMIRVMEEKDRGAVIELMRVFYASEAVLTNGSEEIFNADVDACVGDSPFAEGYVFEEEGAIVGYGMLAKSFSTEYGVPCVWIEDIYVKESARGKGFGRQFLSFVSGKYHGCLLRLEAEEENERALRLYKKNGFTVLPYLELKKDK